MFLTALQNSAQTCHWNSGPLMITAITIGINMFNLLNDYSKVTAAQVEAACMLHIAAHASLCDKPNHK